MISQHVAGVRLATHDPVAEHPIRGICGRADSGNRALTRQSLQSEGVVLTLGGRAVRVDEEDAAFVLAHSWTVSIENGYAYFKTTNNKGPRLRLHRAILGVTDRRVVVDHVSRDTLDNRRSNLRACSHRENVLNSGVRKNNRSGFKGVYAAPGDRWRACLQHHGETIHLGSFRSVESAARAYDEAARELYGEFARLNYPRPGEQPARAGAAS